MSGLRSGGAGEDLGATRERSFEATGTSDLGGKRNDDLGRTDGANQRITS